MQLEVSESIVRDVYKSMKDKMIKVGRYLSPLATSSNRMKINQRLFLLLCWALLIGTASAQVTEVAVGDKNGTGEEDDTMVKVIVGFSSASDKASFEARMILSERSSSSSVSKVTPFRRTHAVALTVSQTELETMQEKNTFKYVEPDHTFQLYQNNNGDEEIPYGIASVLQATDQPEDVFNNDRIPLPPPSSNDQDCFRVCVIDSGLVIDHPDIPFDLDDFRIDGIEFGIPNDEFWYNPDPSTAGHGTHVTGTVFAKGENGLGVVGVVANPQGMCLSVARIFGDREGGTSTSAINSAIEWCADQGSRVINMSLGGDMPDTSSQEIIDAVWEEDGVLVVAAAGNEGDTRKSYPASYTNVLSVAAVDQDEEHAGFSRRNDAVDISAPGVDVRSTSGGGLALLTEDGSELVSNINDRVHAFSRFVIPTNSDVVRDSLEYADCDLGKDKCRDAKNKACLIERGDTLFAEKALNCQEGGGVLAMIYNNEDGIYFGSIGAENINRVDIPVVALTREEGQDLLNGSGTIAVQLQEFGYAVQSGTSMASPHVAGVAAKIWAARPECTNAQVQEALLQSAKPLGGSDGRNDRFGYGLVQAVDSYNYLLSLEEPCGGPPGPTGEPSESPSKFPTLLPSSSPSKLPTFSPSTSPSSSPSESPSSSPTFSPSFHPSSSPTESPSLGPTDLPSVLPSDSPTNSPSESPTDAPSELPSLKPTDLPSSSPSSFPSLDPSNMPTSNPTALPSSTPSEMPSLYPSDFPTVSPSLTPSELPTAHPSLFPTASPTDAPSSDPTKSPTRSPSDSPTQLPSISPTRNPTRAPNFDPTSAPTTSPTESPTKSPTLAPTVAPPTVQAPTRSESTGDPSSSSSSSMMEPPSPPVPAAALQASGIDDYSCRPDLHYNLFLTTAGLLLWLFL